MQVFLGDSVTIEKSDTWVTGCVTGIVLDKAKQLERIYIEGIEAPFWLYQGWKFVEEEKEEGQDNG